MDPATPSGLPPLAEVLRLFDETTNALGGQVRRLEEVLTQKQAELVEANRALATKVQELDQLTRWLELVLGAASTGVVAIDDRAQVTTANPAARTALYGVLPDPAGADWRQRFPDSPLLQVLADGRQRRYERRLPGVDGRQRILACQGAPVVGVDGRIAGAVEVSEDVTELRRLREEAERADRLKQIGEMAAGVAHEIRNPLNGIEGFASLLLREMPADGTPRERTGHRYARMISDGVRDLNAIVSGLLEYTRPRPPRRQAVDPARLVAEVVALVAADRPEGVVVTAQPGWPGGVIDADPAQLRQVLLNLVQNAIHACAESERGTGTITVTVLPRGEGGCRILVDDDGPGIDPDIRQRLFQPFATGRENGTGLGLAVSLVLVQGHGGQLHAEDSPRGGARFRVDL